MNALSPQARQCLTWANGAKALRRYHVGFRPVPGHRRAPLFTKILVGRLVHYGYMVWGNGSKGYALVTDEGRKALEVA